MSNRYITLVMFFTSVFFISAQPKIAVLDATLGEGVPINASAIVADTINEQFVKSDDFTALERAYISSVQEEKKFQLSGDVKEEDIKEIGNTFGADFICIANVSLLGSTYTVSARLIEVATAEVYSQESHRMRGEIDVLFVIAEVVGAELVGVDLTAGPVIATLPVEEEPAEEEPEPEKKPPREKKPFELADPRGHLMISWMFPGYTGDTGNDTYSGDSYYSFYEQHQWVMDNFAVDDAYNKHIGVDLHTIFPVWKFIYAGGGVTFTRQKLVVEDGASLYSYSNFMTLEPYISLGGIVAFTKFVQIYGGGTAGFFLFALGSNYSDDATAAYWTDAGAMATGFSLGFEVGANLFLGPVGLDFRYKWAKSPSLKGDQVFTEEYKSVNGGDTSFGHKGFTLGLGLMF